MKNNLTAIQKELLIEHLFRDERHPGWRTIATKLLDTGKCIVAGRECIWQGGIGNFIETKEAEGAVDCSEYSFDLDDFLTSNYFKDVYNHHVFIFKAKADAAMHNYLEVYGLIDYNK